MAHALAQAGTKTGVEGSSRTDSYMPLALTRPHACARFRLAGAAMQAYEGTSAWLRPVPSERGERAPLLVLPALGRRRRRALHL